MKVRFWLSLLFFSCLAGSPVFGTSPIKSWATDMYDQPAIKSFEQGGMLKFPVGSVTTEGLVIRSDGFKNQYGDSLPWADFSPDGFRYNPALSESNPVLKDKRSLENGRYMYLVNCSACHGRDGKANTNIAKLRAAPAIDTVVPDVSEGYLYSRITYGGPILTSMPPLGYAMSEQERWDVVNYIKSEFKN